MNVINLSLHFEILQCIFFIYKYEYRESKSHDNLCIKSNRSISKHVFIFIVPFYSFGYVHLQKQSFFKFMEFLRGMKVEANHICLQTYLISCSRLKNRESFVFHFLLCVENCN